MKSFGFYVFPSLQLLTFPSFFCSSCTCTELIFKEVNSFKVSGSKTDSLQAEQ